MYCNGFLQLSDCRKVSFCTPENSHHSLNENENFCKNCIAPPKRVEPKTILMACDIMAQPKSSSYCVFQPSFHHFDQVTECDIAPTQPSANGIGLLLFTNRFQCKSISNINHYTVVATITTIDDVVVVVAVGATDPLPLQ